MNKGVCFSRTTLDGLIGENILTKEKLAITMINERHYR